MSRARLDEEFVAAGIDYYASRGALLGLVRSDRLIPWTADNDISLTEDGTPSPSPPPRPRSRPPCVFAEFKKVERASFNASLRARGLGLVSELIGRVCYTTQYKDGVRPPLLALSPWS